MSDLYRSDAGTISVEQGAVVLRVDARVERATLDAFVAGELDDAVLATLGLRPLVEAVARAHILRGAPRVIAASLLPGRPSVPRIFGGGRGARACAWILGRKVSAEADGLRYDGTFEEFAAGGLSPALAAALGADITARLHDAVVALLPLPCLCHTGALTPEQHGSLEVLVHKQNRRAPIDMWATVGRCTVCGRGWTFEEAGDSHYDYIYDVHPFEMLSPA